MNQEMGEKVRKIEKIRENWRYIQEFDNKQVFITLARTQ